MNYIGDFSSKSIGWAYRLLFILVLYPVGSFLLSCVALTFIIAKTLFISPVSNVIGIFTYQFVSLPLRPLFYFLEVDPKVQNNWMLMIPQLKFILKTLVDFMLAAFIIGLIIGIEFGMILRLISYVFSWIFDVEKKPEQNKQPLFVNEKSYPQNLALKGKKHYNHKTKPIQGEQSKFNVSNLQWVPESAIPGAGLNEIQLEDSSEHPSPITETDSHMTDISETENEVSDESSYNSASEVAGTSSVENLLELSNLSERETIKGYLQYEVPSSSDESEGEKISKLPKTGEEGTFETKSRTTTELEECDEYTNETSSSQAGLFSVRRGNDSSTFDTDNSVVPKSK